MADAVHGKNVLISMLEGSEYMPIICGTNCTYQRGVEFVEKTGPASGMSRQWLRRLHEHISTITGLTRIENGDVLSWFYLLGIIAERTFRMTFEDDEANLFSLTGPGLIGTMGIDGPATDFSTGSVEIRWNGEPELTTIEPPGAVGVYELYIDESNGLVVGATSVSHVDLEQTGVEILGAARTGQGLVQVSGTPAAGTRQFKFTGGTGNGIIATDATNPYNSDEEIYVLFKIV